MAIPMVMMPLLSLMDSGVCVRTCNLGGGEASSPLSLGDGGLPRIGTWCVSKRSLSRRAVPRFLLMCESSLDMRLSQSSTALFAFAKACPGPGPELVRGRSGIIGGVE